MSDLQRLDRAMTDDELTDAWEAGTMLHDGVGVNHVEHLRIAWVLHRRHGRHEARRRLLIGTEQACVVHGCPEKFDAALTEQWARVIADATEQDGFGATAADFLAAHPAFLSGALLGRPSRGE